MSLFTKSENTSAFLKMGLLGFAGSGKTKTSAIISIGLVEHMRERQVVDAGKPVFFLDTETGSNWVRPDFEAAGIELFTAKTRAFSDLIAAVQHAEREASVLIIDSISHFWKELGETYMKKKNRSRLQFEDWAFLKAEWGKFTDLYVNSNLHIVLCGRAGYEFDYATDDETGKKNLEKTGIKMRAEGEMGYEPSLLVLMERHQEMEGNSVKRVWRTATVLKDRSTLLDGKEFSEPTFAHFMPHIQLLNLGGKQLGVDTTRTSAHLIPADTRDNRSTQRKIVLDEIESLIVFHVPGMAAADKKRKLELLRTHFEASWTEIESVMPLERLRMGYDTLHFTLEGKYSRYHQERLAVQINDELPEHSAPPKTEAPKAAIDTTDVNGIPAYLRRQPAVKPFDQKEYIAAMAAE